MATESVTPLRRAKPLHVPQAETLFAHLVHGNVEDQLGAVRALHAVIHRLYVAIDSGQTMTADESFGQELMLETVAHMLEHASALARRPR